PVAARRNAGWIYDTLGPAVTMLNVRIATQAARNRVELAQLTALWEAEGQGVTRVQFAPVEREGPLSWHLTSAEREAVQSAWRHARGSGEMQKVREWWSGTSAAGTGRRACPTSP
ncbi:MAG: hypothetical protein ACREJG_11680, partial [Candidatus Rokuibacteriota bacterium]